MPASPTPLRFPACAAAVVVAVTAWSVHKPHDFFTWLLEATPVLIVLPVLALTYGRFRFTNFLYFLIALHCIVLLVGGHYTYARVPLFDYIRDAYGLSRNHYDRVGHIFQGFVPALAGREILLRTSAMKRGLWLSLLLFLGCLGISALYEVVEWVVAALTGTAADSFLGAQGDVWDSQKDMFFAGAGAGMALLLFPRLHDRFLRQVA